MSITDTLTDEELRGLTKQLLVDRLSTAYQALIDVSGEAMAVKALVPYVKHGGMAMASNIKASAGLSNSMETIALILNYADDCLSDGHCTIERYENGFVSEVKGCIMSESNGFCPAALVYTMEGINEAIDPSSEIVYLQTVTRDDPTCRYIIKRRQTSEPDGYNLGNKTGLLDKKAVPPEEMHSLLCQYLGEWWNLITKAFVDIHGSERTIELLAPYMRHSGMSAGILMSKRFKLQSNDLNTLTVLIDFYGNVVGQKGGIKYCPDSVVKTMTECPFSDASPEICAQFEQLSNGICEAINPDYEFRYDHMRTKGDGACRWTIKRKTNVKMVLPEAQVGHDDGMNLAILKKRLAQGEITLAEYKELKSELMS